MPREDKLERVRIETDIVLGQFALLAAGGKLPRVRREEMHSNLLLVIEKETAGEEIRRRCLEPIAPLDSSRVKQEPGGLKDSPYPDARQAAREVLDELANSTGRFDI